MTTAVPDRVCAHCGEVFEAGVHDVARGYGRYCSRACSGAGRRRRVERACAFCGGAFTTTPSVTRRGQGRYCSRSCARAAAPEPTEDTVRRFRAGEPLRRLAQDLGVHPDTVARRLRRAGVWERRRGPRRRPLAERFWERVDKRGPVPPHRPQLGPCWVWTGPTAGGYGVIGSGGSRAVGAATLRAHRLSWELAHPGEAIPEGAFVCHTCDNRSCVRPDHLFLGTPLENNRDMVRKGRQQRAERSGRAKLQWPQVRAIRERYATGGVTQQQLASEYGVTVGAISQIVRRLTWLQDDES